VIHDINFIRYFFKHRMCCCQHERGLGVQVLKSIEQIRLVKSQDGCLIFLP